MFTIRCSLARILCTEVWLSLDLGQEGWADSGNNRTLRIWNTRKRGRVVEGNSLENCRTRKGIRGSNPLASAFTTLKRSYSATQSDRSFVKVRYIVDRANTELDILRSVSRFCATGAGTFGARGGIMKT